MITPPAAHLARHPTAMRTSQRFIKAQADDQAICRCSGQAPNSDARQPALQPGQR
jgi:hypothetical protein